MTDPSEVLYLVPHTVADAVHALQEHPTGRVIVGGTDLMVALRDGRARPPALVDLSRIPELGRIEDREGELRIGATAKVTDVIAHPAIAARCRALVQAGRLLGGWQIQNMATLGGNLCNASPAAETAGPLLVLEAEVETQGPSGNRRIPLAQFWTGPGKTVLGAAEIMTAIVIPASSDGSRSAYERVHIRHSVDIALVCASARLEMDGAKVRVARIALGAVAPTPFRALEAENSLQGAALTDEALQRVAELARVSARPISDVRASAEYRRAMAGVLARRVVEQAAGR